MYYLYFLKDNKANATFGPLLTCRNDAEATRYFRDLLGNKQTLPGQHPQDFDLYCTASYDDQTGVTYWLNEENDPVLIITGDTIHQLTLGTDK